MYLFFVNVMRCRRDVAMLLAKTLTVDNHLPTGSPVSPILSFFAHKLLFDKIADLASQNELIFTLYIDDMCLSGDLASRKILFDVRHVIASNDLKSHKCRFFRSGVPRVVTGVALTSRGPRLPHRRRRKIHESVIQLKSLSAGSSCEGLLRATVSRMYEAAQLEPIWRKRAQAIRALFSCGSQM